MHVPHPVGRGEYEEAVRDLDHRYDEMLERLNGTYQLP